MLTALVGLASEAQQPNCADLPEGKQPACWMVLACAAIDDQGRRQECFDAAAERFGAAGEAGVEAGVKPAVTVETAVAIEPDPAEPAHDPASAIKDPQQQAEPLSAKPRAGEVGSVKTSGARGASSSKTPDRDASTSSATPLTEGTAATNRPPKFDVPNRFSAKITGVRQLVRDRYLVALDDKYLFEGERAGVGRFERGDCVDVVRTSALFGRRYRITSSSGRPITATRIRCEESNLNAANRRKCDAMLAKASVD